MLVRHAAAPEELASNRQGIPFWSLTGGPGDLAHALPPMVTTAGCLWQASQVRETERRDRAKGARGAGFPARGGHERVYRRSSGGSSAAA